MSDSLITLDLLPPPSCFGDMFPPKFTTWRDDQPLLISRVLNADERFTAHAAPTGFGKSPSYMGAALLSGFRTCILTSTKGLQEQLLTDFNADGVRRLYDIRGQNAYRCVAAESFGVPYGTTCDYAPCHAGKTCSKKDGGCLYYDAQREASTAQIVITNYAYWMSANRYGRGLGKFDLLVLDEAHDVPDLLASFMAVELEPADLTGLSIRMLDAGADAPTWREWATFHLAGIKQRAEQLAAVIRISGNVTERVLRESAVLKRVLSKFEVLSTMSDDWVIERVERRVHGRLEYCIKFDPLWPYDAAEPYLFCGIPRICFVSATLRPKTLHLLGVRPPHYEFYDYDSSFPVERRPIIHVPTTQMNHRTGADGIALWQARINQILSTRLDRKGIIHTVSYARAKSVMDSSDFSWAMHTHDTKTTKWTVEAFKRADPPSILVSPSVTTGYDFPYTECEFQIIGKLPFPDNRAKVIKARMEKDHDYSAYITMQTLIQMCGRGMRAGDDRCETLIIDDSIRWFMKQNAEQFAPPWFRAAIRWEKTIPAPLEKL